MEPTFLSKMYENQQFQEVRWKTAPSWSFDFIQSLSEFEIKMFHHDKLAQLSLRQKLAFTEEQKSYMNAEQLAAITVPPL